MVYALDNTSSTIGLAMLSGDKVCALSADTTSILAFGCVSSSDPAASDPAQVVVETPGDITGGGTESGGGGIELPGDAVAPVSAPLLTGSIASSDASLSWTPVEGATSYEVSRSYVISDGTALFTLYSSTLGASMAVNASGDVYVVDTGYLRKVSPSGEVKTLTAYYGAYSAKPWAVTNAPDGDVYLAAGHAVFKVNPDDTFTPIAGTDARGMTDAVGDAAKFVFDYADIYYGPDGLLYVLDQSGLYGYLRTLDPSTGEVVRVKTSDGSDVRPTMTHALAVRSDGTVFFGTGTSVKSFTPGAASVVTAYSASPITSILDLAFNSSGELLVVGPGRHNILSINPSGDQSILAGSSSGYQDGPSFTALFSNPEGLALTPTGGLYVADASNRVIRYVSPSAQVSTFAGEQGVSGRTDSTVSVSEPLAVYSGSNLSAFDINLVNQGMYRYQARAVNAAGFGPWSDILYLRN